MYVGSGSANVASYDGVCDISRCPCLLQGMSVCLSVCVCRMSVCVRVTADLWTMDTLTAECLLIIRAARTE